MDPTRSSDLPSISVVTPSFNQAAFLPRCIESVGSQSHSPVEHLIYDPGSTDGSREIASAAESVRLIAEPDEGQSDAVARGCREATGDIIAWLNSDDYYFDDQVFALVAARFAEPDRPDVVYGRGPYLSPAGEVLGQAYIFEDADRIAQSLSSGVGVLCPATFVRRDVMNELGGPDPSLHYAMDYDLWIRLAKAGKKFAFLDRDLAVAVIHEDAKTEDGTGGSLNEALTVVQRHYGHVSWSWAIGEARADVLGANGVVMDDMTSDELARVQKRAQQLFDGHNRNLSTVARLARPPWQRSDLRALSHLLRRVR